MSREDIDYDKFDAYDDDASDGFERIKPPNNKPRKRKDAPRVIGKPNKPQRGGKEIDDSLFLPPKK